MRFYRSLLLAILLGLACPALAAQRPNVIMLLIDDMGWGDLSCFGNTEAKTPNIDRMAAEGIRFSQFYVNSPICSASRCALTTGQYPQRWRISSYLDNRAVNARRGVADWLDVKAPSVARFLHEAGYATGHFGKWHLGGQRNVDDAPPITAYGFDESLTNFEGMGPKLLPLTMKPGDTKPGRIWEDAVRLGQPVTWMQRSAITTGYVDAALSFMDKAQRDQKPFFINLWPDDVHSPYWPPVDKWGKTKREMYLAVLVEMDRQLGKLFDRLHNDAALRDNTVLILCSDNGPEPGGGSAGPLRGWKTTIYEGGTRSPLIVWAPALQEKSKQGTNNQSSVFAAFDLVPSILTLAGVAKPAGINFDGEDVAPVLLGKSDASRHAPVFWRRPPDRKNWLPHIVESQPDLTVREGNWKLLCDYDGTHPVLYEVGKDQSETKDVASEHPDIVARLKAAAIAWHQSMPADKGPELPAGKVNDKAAQKERIP